MNSCVLPAQKAKPCGCCAHQHGPRSHGDCHRFSRWATTNLVCAWWSQARLQTRATCTGAAHQTLSASQNRNNSHKGAVQFQMEGKFIFMRKKMPSSLQRPAPAVEGGKPPLEGEGGAVDTAFAWCPPPPSKGWVSITLYLYTPTGNMRPTLGNSFASRRICKCHSFKLCVKLFKCPLKTLLIICLFFVCGKGKILCPFFFPHSPCSSMELKVDFAGWRPCP